MQNTARSEKAARKRGGPKAGPAPKRRKIKNPDAMDSDDEFFPPEGGALPKRKKLKPKLKRKKPKQKPNQNLSNGKRNPRQIKNKTNGNQIVFQKEELNKPNWLKG